MRKTFTDWRNLSLVERGSAIEVLEAAFLFRDNPSMQRTILEHAIEEYRHADIFQELATHHKQPNFRGNETKALISASGLGNISESWARGKAETTFRIEIGERRALEALNGLVLKHSDEFTSSRLELIKSDEIRHADGLTRFNQKLISVQQLKGLWIRFAFGLSDRRQGIANSKVVSFLTRLFFRLVGRMPLDTVSDIKPVDVKKEDVLSASKSII
jgi:rubrerythrin